MKWALLLISTILWGTWAMAGIVDTPHNLSKSGTGAIKSTTEERVCIYCHTPHDAMSEAPLWNRELSTQSYTLYSSPTLDATVTQPQGSSKLCLSCHDGTLALNAIHSSTLPIATDLSQSLFNIGSSSNLETNLENDHPISFEYTIGLDQELNDPTNLPSFILLQNGRVECTSCHDPHTSDYPQFLRTSKNQLCIACHNKPNFNGSAHDYMEAAVNAEYACENCHEPHNAAGIDSFWGKSTFLLRNNQENLCFECHTNIQDKMAVDNGYDAVIGAGTRIFYRYTNLSHDVTDEQQNNSRAHIECINCHGPHMAEVDTDPNDNQIANLVDPDNLKDVFTFNPNLLPNLSGSDASTYWRNIYAVDEFCLKCHDGGLPNFDSTRPDLTVANPENGMFNINTSWHTKVHGNVSPSGARIPCLTCHDPHGGNYFLMRNEVSWEGTPPFADNGRVGDITNSTDYSRTITDDNSGQTFYGRLCTDSCHTSITEATHKPNYGTSFSNCQRCHHHQGRF